MTSETVMPEFFDLGNGMAVCADGIWRGWLMRRHPDGQLVSVRKLPSVAEPYGAMEKPDERT